MCEYIFVPTSDAEYERLQSLLNDVLDAGGADENSPLASLAEVIGSLLEPYEAKHYAIEPATPAQMLQHLMDQHDLKQADLAGEMGGQAAVSKVLSGQRELNKRQIEALSKRFNVSPALFF